MEKASQRESMTLPGKMAAFLLLSFVSACGGGSSSCGGGGSNDHEALRPANTTASAIVDYAAKTVIINIQPGATQQWITQHSSVYGLNGPLPGTALTLQGLELTGHHLFYQPPRSQQSGPGMGLVSVDTVNFFGAHVEELAGVADYSSLVPAMSDNGSAVNSNSIYTTSFQTISFALVRQ